MNTVRLNNGILMPQEGFGVFQISDLKQCKDVVMAAIANGCRLIDTASSYKNEKAVGEEDTRKIIKYALDNGINFFDTAIAYQLGTSELYVGRALRDMAKRDDVVVATKFLPRTAEEIQKGVSGQRHVEDSINVSLEHLGMDYVDLYIYHIWDYKTPMEEILEGMNNVVKEGKARYLGIANVYPYQLVKMNDLAEKNGWAKIISVQSHYNLIMREEEREMFQLCHEDGIAMTPYSALASGKLSRKPGETSNRLQKDAYLHHKYNATANEDNKIVGRVAELADRYGVTMTEISLAWILRKVDAPIVGATKLHHIDGPVNAFNIHLTDEDMKYLEELYVPHRLEGVMADNKPTMANEPVWVTASRNK